MSIIDKLTAIQDTIPHYWPIGSFIHHNPLKGFEDMHFKDALAKAQSIFGGRVYMEPAYYLGLYDEGKIQLPCFEKNLLKMLKEYSFEAHEEEAKQFLMEVSPQWESFRSYKKLKVAQLDMDLVRHLEVESLYNNKKAYVEKLLADMTLYEIHDAMFDTNEKEIIEKEIIEYISRFLDEAQATIHMDNRDLGMFNTFKIYEGMSYKGDAQSYVESALETLKIKDVEAYFLTHILKLHGWAGFIKYRSQDENYFSQKEHPSSLIDYLAIRLYFELKYTEKTKLNDFEKLDKYIEDNHAYACLKLLQNKGKLSGKYIDDMEEHKGYTKILEAYVGEEIRLDALQIQEVQNALPTLNATLTFLEIFIQVLRREEGFIWLKSLEDSYIYTYVDAFIQAPKPQEKPLSAATFCLDVRSETIRRKIEESGAYITFGAGGFLGIPIAFVEFDKAHELLLAPAIVKPQNIVFEVPLEDYHEYSTKNTMNKTSKKVLSDLKNNPYTPYIMVEAIGWIFSINLFGKTFFPKKTNAFFENLKAKKPKTTYTLDKLSKSTIEIYVRKLHIKIIKEKLNSVHIVLSEEEVEHLWKHLVFDARLTIELPEKILYALKVEYHISQEDYLIQKEKLSRVGFTLDEKVMYLENFLKMIGQVKDFPKFFTIVGHGSVSDNNPFESALDCGACGGSISLPNTRTLCMIGNNKEVRERLVQNGIDIAEEVRFIPALHITTTDEIKFYDTEVLDREEIVRFEQVKEDFSRASMEAREERMAFLPNTNSQEEMLIKSMDWSEPRPEWGLAGNMGVFAGPRSSAKNIAFNNRLFLHSYDWKIDNDNADILTRIFDGPLVVGEWINLEHYFATVDNRVYGAGSKVYHNVVSKVGVYNGNYSDLKIGLPSQSVLLEGKAYHEPVRLLTFMEAPLDKVGKAVENSIAKPFILNEWIRPIIIDKEAKKVYSYEYGEFIVIKELP
ncbi:MAG: Na-translocating system protein MpsB [Sulfurovum sp.]|nr:Na-translocating system protein MpsB [Sulfurovum sp.]